MNNNIDVMKPVAYRRTSDGFWLVRTQRATHTGDHSTITFVEDINKASTGYLLGSPERKMISRGELELVNVKVTRKVELVGEV